MLNLTPHAITLMVGDKTLTLPPSGTIARVSVTQKLVGTVLIDGVDVPVFSRTMGTVEGLPPAGTPCIVSALVAGAVPGRPGVFCPDTGPTAIRDNKGHVMAVTRFVAA